MTRTAILWITILLVGCGRSDQMFLLDHPRSQKIRDDSDVVYILRQTYPAVYQDILEDRCGQYEGRITQVYDADHVALEFPPGASLEAILAKEIIVFRDNTFLAFATPDAIEGQRIRYRLVSRANGSPQLQVGDRCLGRL
jgi:hypothetical protein